MGVMGVDGIGSGGGGRPVPGVGAPDPTGVREVTSDASADPVEGRSTSGVDGSAALERLRRGEIDLDQYLDTRVDEAVRPFSGRLPAEQLEFVKSTLREQLATDPVLVELVRQTTSALGSG
jgi:hypothetical protein